ncbi:MAG: anthranilate synthase component I family protein [Desulfovibrionaceae bacterium]|nr:anthranilate synthase component I family protein [Desulfovibrionaceae bacterium]
MDQIHIQQKARYLPADTETPISLFMGMAQKGILLESAEVDGRWGRYSVLVQNEALRISCTDGKLALASPDPTFAPLLACNGLDFIEGLRTVLAHITLIAPEGMNLPPITRALYGYLGFGMAGLFSSRLAKTMPVSEAECTLILPDTVLVFDHLYNRLCQISLHEHVDIASSHTMTQSEGTAGPVTASPDREGYIAYVEQIKEMLGQGEAIQVVPSVRFSCEYTGDPFVLYRRMRRLNASPYMFYMAFPDHVLFGSSPEVMVRCQENRLTLSPIAGTRRRGVDEREDAFLESELLHDPKECAEHVMLVDLGRNDLGRIAKPGSVTVERSMHVERFSHVMHITSNITAQLGEGFDALDVLMATFPAGTVSGAPKIRAMEILRTLEGESRGPYAGCIGWIGLDHESVNLDMGITIRSMWQRNGKLFWQAGGGIVHDSDPALEWKEVTNKSAIMRLVLETKDEAYVSAHR